MSAATDAARRARLKAERKCIDCRADLSMFEWWKRVRCFECHERNGRAARRHTRTRAGRKRHREYMAARYRDRRARGICVVDRCGRSTKRARCDAHEEQAKMIRIAYLDRKDAERHRSDEATP